MRTTALLALTAAVLTATAACASDPTPDTPAAPSAAAPDPARAPEQVRWEQWQGVALPYSAIDGPKSVNAAATGYTHTPQGAALAAIQHSIRTSLAPDGSWAAVAAAALVSGPGKDAYVLARAQVSLSTPDPAMLPTIQGYKITNWTPDRADLTIYTRYTDSSHAALHHRVEWVAGDWRLTLPDPESASPVVEDISATPADMVTLAGAR